MRILLPRPDFKVIKEAAGAEAARGYGVQGSRPGGGGGGGEEAGAAQGDGGAAQDGGGGGRRRRRQEAADQPGRLQEGLDAGGLHRPRGAPPPARPALQGPLYAGSLGPLRQGALHGQQQPHDGAAHAGPQEHPVPQLGGEAALPLQRPARARGQAAAAAAGGVGLGRRARARLQRFRRGQPGQRHRPVPKEARPEPPAHAGVPEPAHVDQGEARLRRHGGD
mmetsp:Transcript_11652/g.32445  ORF Transcript_11652/g.32445 Transcript_11652/m.32445 type:complete len:222 (-) Transcript_11652:288-953(-)